MTKWQPIETAPKDGTEIDVWEFCHDPKWRPDAHGLASGMRITEVRWSNGGWQRINYDVGDWYPIGNSHYTVSHWMPIPGPPVVDGEEPSR